MHHPKLHIHYVCHGKVRMRRMGYPFSSVWDLHTLVHHRPFHLSSPPTYLAMISRILLPRPVQYKDCFSWKVSLARCAPLQPENRNSERSIVIGQPELAGFPDVITLFYNPHIPGVKCLPLRDFPCMKEATKGKGGKGTEGKVGLRFIPYFVHSSLAAVSRLKGLWGK